MVARVGYALTCPILKAMQAPLPLSTVGFFTCLLLDVAESPPWRDERARQQEQSCIPASKRRGLLPQMAVTSSGSSMLLMVDDAQALLVCLLDLLVFLFLAWS